MTFTMVDIIERKRDGKALTSHEIGWVMSEYTADAIPDYQMAALLMAVFHQGLDTDELAAWTDAMLHSGDVLDFSDVAKPKVDKHSTGGVGDKVSIPLAPIVAACGVAVPMMSGRGLGHTGGTLDKLETIEGFRTQLDPEEFGAVLRRHGMVMGGQSETLVPADRRIYALRDATATVPSIPLIASSIMSKKLAEGLDALVLDVKVGSGAFMKNEADATRLARTMVDIGAARGTQVVALLTDMSQPLGDEVGNATEVRESILTLRGNGPADLTELTYRLAVEMLLVGGITSDPTDALARVTEAVASGAAARVFQGVIESQDGNPAVVADPGLLPEAHFNDPLPAPRSGYVGGCDALLIGKAAGRLGAGRQTKEDGIDPAVGITILKKRGDLVAEGEPLARVAWNERDRLDAAMPLLTSAWSIDDQEPASQPLIIGEVR